MGNFIFGGGSKSLNKGGLLTYRGSKALPLSFTLQPQAKTVDEYALATFSCDVTGGTAPYTYQWKKNGTNVGTNSANLSFTAAAADKNASITVVVTDSVGTVITSGAVVLGVTSYRYVLDGSSQYHNTTQRLINIASDIDITLHIRHTASLFLYETLISQTQTTVVANSEFLLRVRDNGDLYMAVGGADTTFSLASRLPLSNINTTLRIHLVGTSLKLYYNGVLSETRTFTRGVVTEPSAVTRIGGVLSSGNLINNWKGSIDNAIVGGVSMPLNNKSLGANQFGGIASTIINYSAASWVAI